VLGAKKVMNGECEWWSLNGALGTVTQGVEQMRVGAFASCKM